MLGAVPQRASWSAGSSLVRGDHASWIARELAAQLGDWPRDAVGSFEILDGEGAEVAALGPVVRAARDKGLGVWLIVGEASHSENALVAQLADHGLSGVCVRVDGWDAASHGLGGCACKSFAHAATVIAEARRLGLAVIVRTVVHAALWGELLQMAGAVQNWGAQTWRVGPSAHADVPLDRLEPLAQELAAIATSAKPGPLMVAVHLPFYFRIALAMGVRAPAVCDERRAIHIGAEGELTPGPDVPVTVGNLRTNCLLELYERHPLLRALRDPDAVEGKCGCCEYRKHCGGSRVRSLRVNGNLFGSDPACSAA